jgi:hypothetical protein
MDTEKLFTTLFDYTDSETGVRFELNEITEEDGVTTGTANFYLEDEFIGYCEYRYHESEKTFEPFYTSFGRLSGNGIMTRFGNHMGHVLKKHKVKYFSADMFSATRTVAEKNGLQENNITDIGNMIIEVKDWKE